MVQVGSGDEVVEGQYSRGGIMVPARSFFPTGHLERSRDTSRRRAPAIVPAPTDGANLGEILRQAQDDSLGLMEMKK